MKRISIYVPESAVMESITNPRYLFSAANEFLQAAGKPALFQIRLVGQQPEVQLQHGAYSVHTDCTLDDAGNSDLIIIPALFGNMNQAIQQNEKALGWITRQYKKGSEVASLCVGAFLLASTGLLNGKKCSTHWAYYAEFKEMFPEVDVQDGSIVTEENGIYSSGGANSYWNLLLHLLEKYTDRDTAILAAKYFAIDIDRDSQAAFSMFKGQKSHTDEAILNVQEFIEKNWALKITVEQLSEHARVSRRSLERRFKQATGNTLIEYIQRIRVEAAKRNFESTRKNISEVMYDVGYTDTKAFRTVFKKITGLTPLEYRNKYSKQVV